MAAIDKACTFLVDLANGGVYRGGGVTEDYAGDLTDAEDNGDCVSDPDTMAGGDHDACTATNFGGSVIVTYTNGFIDCVSGMIAFAWFESGSSYASGRYAISKYTDSAVVLVGL